uniref:Uncharacterized protein n=1 Tax=Zea mays TaxID=4577 RepID=C4IYV6_MAIZE|nr:unknown [Zea mays]
MGYTYIRRPSPPALSTIHNRTKLQPGINTTLVLLIDDHLVSIFHPGTWLIHPF